MDTLNPALYLLCLLFFALALRDAPRPRRARRGEACFLAALAVLAAMAAANLLALPAAAVAVLTGTLVTLALAAPFAVTRWLHRHARS